MDSLAELDRGLRGVTLTDLDAYINGCMGRSEDYAAGIADRNDYAIMLARTTLAQTGCPATRNRVMPPC